MFVAGFQYHVIFDCEQLPVTEAMPVWILPMCPSLIFGPLGSTLLKCHPTDSGLPIWLGSLTFTGLGWTFAFFMLSLYITRLVNSDMPEASKRPGMYATVGPAAYTANTFVALAMYAPKRIHRELSLHHLGAGWRHSQGGRRRCGHLHVAHRFLVQCLHNSQRHQHAEALALRTELLGFHFP